MRKIQITLTFILALACDSISASWVEDKSFDEKAKSSDVVLVGRVLERDIKLQGNPNSRAVSIEVEAVFVESSGSRRIAVGEKILFVHSFGSLEQDDVYCCSQGKRYLLFLKQAEGRADGFVSANGPYGAYMLRNEAEETHKADSPKANDEKVEDTHKADSH